MLRITLSSQWTTQPGKIAILHFKNIQTKYMVFKILTARWREETIKIQNFGEDYFWKLNAHCNLTMLQTLILDTRNAEPNFMFTEPKNSFFSSCMQCKEIFSGESLVWTWTYLTLL